MKNTNGQTQKPIISSPHITWRSVFSLYKCPICELVLFLVRNCVKGKLVYKIPSS